LGDLELEAKKKDPRQRAGAVPMLLRWSGWLLYAAGLVVVAGVTAYFAFNLFVRSGVTSLPELQNLTEAEAVGVLAEYGLTLRRQEDGDDFDDTVEAGKVLRQSPGPRTLVKRGSQVIVTLSLGPQVIEVPDVTGQSAQAAQVTLAASGLALGRTLGVLGNRPAGTVVQQSPQSGAPAAPNTAIDLLLSRQNIAETFVMPDLVYRRYEVIRRFFEQRSFQMGSVKYELYEGIPEGVILRQFPLAGHPLQREDAISLVVSTTVEGLPRP